MVIDGYVVEVVGDMELPDEEIREYLNRGKDKFGDSLRGLILKPDGEYIDIEYDVKPEGFQRLRRITGYLVGTMDRWNNGKRAEERDRVKHGMEAVETMEE